MKKFVNVRLPVILACSVAAGIGVAYTFKFFVVETIWCVAAAAIAAALILIIGLTLKKIKPIIFIILSLLCFFAGFFNSNARMTNFEKSEIEDGGSYFISAEIEDLGYNKLGVYAILKNASADTKELSGKISAQISYEYSEGLEVGYKIEFVTELHTTNKLFEYGELNRNAEKNIKYGCNISKGIVITDSTPSFFPTIRAAIKGTLFDNLSESTAAICYGMLIGDTDYIEQDAMENFRYGGVAHIFAVSGLHIALIYGAVNFLLKKLIVNNQAASILSIAVIFFYAGICGFTLSSIRAAIMCTINALTKIVHLKYDGLNSLAFSVIIVLSVTPLSLFSLGYQLSVCAVGGIVILSKNIEKALKKAKIPKKISEAAGVSFGAQLGTMPVMLCGFGYLSGAGMTLNLVIMPIVSTLFSVMFFGTVICTIIPPIAAAIMPLAVLPLEGILSFLLITGFENSLISGFGAQLFVPIYYLAVLTISDKLNLGPCARFIGVAASIFTLTVYVILKTYSPFGGFEIFVSAKNSNCVLFKSQYGKVLVIDDTCTSYVDDTLNDYYSTDLDGVIILGGEDCVMAYGKSGLKCKDVYVCKLYIEMQPYDYATVHYEKDFSIAGINFTYHNGSSLIADCDGVSVGICSGYVSLESCDLLISAKENKECEAKNTVYFSLSDYYLNTYDYGDLKFTVKDNSLRLDTLLPQITCLN